MEVCFGFGFFFVLLQQVSSIRRIRRLLVKVPERRVTVWLLRNNYSVSAIFGKCP